MAGLPPDPTGLAALLGDTEVRRMIGDLVARKLRADLAALRGGAELIGRWRADGDGAAAGRPAAAPGGDGVIKDLVRLHLEYYTALVDLTSDFHERTRAVLGGEPPAPASPPAPAPDPEMLLSGAVGGTARGAFRVENTTSAPMTVELVASPFIDPVSGRTVEPGVAFDPPRVELTPGQEERVTALVPVTEAFAPGARYVATISAAGIDAVRIAVRLDVDVAPAAPEPPAVDPAARKPAARKPAAKRPAAKKPAVKKPAAGKAAATKPTARKRAPATAAARRPATAAPADHEA